MKHARHIFGVKRSDLISAPPKYKLEALPLEPPGVGENNITMDRREIR
jgi:hypothetical protein